MFKVSRPYIDGHNSTDLFFHLGTVFYSGSAILIPSIFLLYWASHIERNAATEGGPTISTILINLFSGATPLTMLVWLELASHNSN